MSKVTVGGQQKFAVVGLGTAYSYFHDCLLGLSLPLRVSLKIRERCFKHKLGVTAVRGAASLAPDRRVERRANAQTGCRLDAQPSGKYLIMMT